MKFRISRTSKPSWGEPDEESPCPGAVLDGYDWWLEVATLEDLLDLAATVSGGELVVSAGFSPEAHVVRIPVPYVEIYDDYRE